MQKNRMRRIAGGLALSLATILLVTNIIDSQSNVAQAKEVFQDVKDLRDQIAQDPGKQFTILEIVDEKSTFPAADEVLDANPTVTLGEEEIGYLVGGGESYAEYYQALVEAGQHLAGLLAVTPEDADAIIGQSATLKENYKVLVAALTDAGIVDEVSKTKPLGKIDEKTTYAPTLEDFQQLIVSVTKAADTVTEGFLVADPNGLYAEDGNGVYQYVGVQNTISFLPVLGEEEDTVSGNDTVSDNDTVPGNDVESDNDAVSDNDTSAEDGTLSEEEVTSGDDTVSENDTAAMNSRIFIRTAQLEEAAPSGEAVVTMAVGERYHFYTNEADIPEGLTGIPVTVGAGQGQIETIYQFTFQGLENWERLRTEVFGIELGDKEALKKMNIQVLTCTPDDSQLLENIAAADLVYLNADGLDKHATSTADISVEAALLLLNRITARPDLPCIINDGMYTAFNDETNQTKTNNNLNKLLHLLYQKEVKGIYEVTDTKFYEAATWDFGIHEEPWSKLTITTSPNGDGAEVENANRTGKGHFVRENIYVIGSSDGTYKPVYQGFAEPLLDTDPADFTEVKFRMEQEQYDRKQQGLPTYEEKKSPAVAVQTILVYTGDPVIIEKGSLKVLELQPCYSFTYANGTAGKEAFKKKYLPEDFNLENLTIVGMTTSEFCGKIEDINVEYDMIYFGSNTDLMNTVELVDANGDGTGEFITGYNDKEMFGVVYAHTGDTTKLGAMYGLVWNNEKDTYRYSGNDILEEQEEKLLEFLKSGAPVVVADDFFLKKNGENARISSGSYGSFDGNGEFQADVPVSCNSSVHGGITEVTRQGILDSSSYIYRFVKEACKADENGNVSWEDRPYQNFLTEGVVTQENFVRWINQPKLTLHMMEFPTEYRYTTNTVTVDKANGTKAEAHVIADSTYLMPAEDGKNYLSYEFSFTNIASTNAATESYSVSLYVDTNMDGKFAGEGEKQDGFTIVDLRDNSHTGEGNLRTGVPYRLVRQLPDDYVGAIPWKLVITSNSNGSIRGAATGMTAVRTEKQTIRVLQLYGRDTSNLQEEMEIKRPNGLWATLLADVPSFDVEITSVSGEAYFGNTVSDDSPELAAVGDINTYDMLIVGFDDVYFDAKSWRYTHQERLRKVMDFARSGKCVLFSHDVTNWWNDGGQNNTLNMSIRDITGLDRYGASIGRGDKGSIPERPGMTIVQSGQGAKANSKEELEKIIFENGMGARYDRDVAFKLNTNQKEMVPQTQAVTYTGGGHNVTKENENQYFYLNFNWPMLRDTWNYQYWGEADVGKVNSGAITEYPYKLPDTIRVAHTHGQYYQLDLESDNDGDGEGDIAVWYCFNNSKPGAGMNDVYDYSPNDVRNNYYIYNRGNITYTGMGHVDIDNEEEIKLFINTMIAAYRVSMKSPQINIVENAEDLTDKSYDVIPYDEAVSEEQKNNGIVPTYRIYFQAKDNNFISNSNKMVSYRLLLQEENGEEEIFLGEEKLKATVTNKTEEWRVHHSITGAEVPIGDDPNDNPDRGVVGGSLENGVVYYVDVPISLLDKGDSFQLYVEVQSTITKNGKDNVSAKVYDTITVNKLQLFDLD